MVRPRPPLDRAAHGPGRATGAVLIALLTLSACATGPSRRQPSPPVGTTRDAGVAIVANATAALGQPYHYGGAAPGGFDCSGLVQYASNSAGVGVPRTALEQLHAGVRIARQELRPGDLVFMRLAHKELHVGIAVDANHFIHAPSSGGRVRIDPLDAPPYDRGFIEARRIVDAALTQSR